MSLFSVLHSELSYELINCNASLELITDFIKSKNAMLQDEEIGIVKRAIQKRFLGHFKKRWQESYKLKSHFFKKNEDWLKSTFKEL